MENSRPVPWVWLAAAAVLVCALLVLLTSRLSIGGRRDQRQRDAIERAARESGKTFTEVPNVARPIQKRPLSVRKLQSDGAQREHSLPPQIERTPD